MYIAVSGNIGSGKTTLVEMLAECLGWRPFYEDISNPYLDDFYQDMERWSFKMQVAFLSRKVAQIKEINRSEYDVIQDRTIFEEGHVFVENLHDMSLMSKRDYDLYMDLFSYVIGNVKMPDLIIYLKGSVPTLISQIQKRGREFEMGISEEYLGRLNDYYNSWVDIYKGELFIVDIDNDDFMLDSGVLDSIVAKIESKRTNLKSLYAK